ncbi:MAG TPA: Crp/Fnr family transcriptional regulator [Gammaproteobacteria bacterium]|nr:Crp/Fnr family transcriptional regulator [Gammaproteobacteria bacterium]
MPIAANPKVNYILASLPADAYARLAPHLEEVSLTLGQSLYESGVELKHMYFPIDCIISLLYVAENGTSSEISVVGYEGILGIGLFMGGGGAPNRAIVQNAGTAFRLKAGLLKDEFVAGGSLLMLLLRYTQALMTQMAQTAVCNRHHSVEQQLCRWVLLSIDRLPSDEMKMTNLLVANMLGIRLDKVMDMASRLQFTRLIHYDSGNITVLNRPGLEILVCECYQVIKKEYARLQPVLKAA